MPVRLRARQSLSRDPARRRRGQLRRDLVEAMAGERERRGGEPQGIELKVADRTAARLLPEREVTTGEPGLAARRLIGDGDGLGRGAAPSAPSTG